MLGQRLHSPSPRPSVHPPFPRILCAVDDSEAADHAIAQALAVAGADSRVTFAASWYGGGSRQRMLASDERARKAVGRAVARARAAGVAAERQPMHSPRLGEALLKASALYDLIVVAAHPHRRATGILLGECATQLVHRSHIPVL